LSYKAAPKINTFCDSLEPNKHWSKRLRFGEEFPAENPTYGVLPTEYKAPNPTARRSTLAQSLRLYYCISKQYQ
jgi:hypothetical protein